MIDVYQSFDYDGVTYLARHNQQTMAVWTIIGEYVHTALYKIISCMIRLVVTKVGYERNRNLKALTRNLPRIRLLVSVLGSGKFQIPGIYSVIGFTIWILLVEPRR
jgi:hypothetical protein